MFLYSFNYQNCGFWKDWNKYSKNCNSQINSLYYNMLRENPEYDILNYKRGYNLPQSSWEELIAAGLIKEIKNNENSERNSNYDYIIYPYKLRWRQGIYIEKDKVAISFSDTDADLIGIASNQIIVSNVKYPVSVEEADPIKYPDFFRLTSYLIITASLPRAYLFQTANLISLHNFENAETGFSIPFFLSYNDRFLYHKIIKRKATVWGSQIKANIGFYTGKQSCIPEITLGPISQNRYEEEVFMDSTISFNNSQLNNNKMWDKKIVVELKNLNVPKLILKFY